jgi:hypothetical protein
MWYSGFMDKNTDQIDDTQTHEWPNVINTREELDSALEEGLKSGVSPYNIEQITQKVIARLRNG